MAVNKVILIGNLGKDPELRYTPNGTAVVNFTLATSENYKDRDGNQQEKTEWHSIVAWRQLAEICGKYLHKGKQVYVEGKLQTRKWQDKNGVDRYTTEIVADTMQMLGTRDDGQRSQGQSNSQGYASDGRAYGSQPQSENSANPQNRPVGYQNDPNYTQGNVGGKQDDPPLFDPDDEIPF